MAFKIETTITCDRCKKEIKSRSRQESRRRGGYTTILTDVYTLEVEQGISANGYPENLKIERGYQIFDTEDNGVRLFCSRQCVLASAAEALKGLKPWEAEKEESED